jgi:hypothetical protein
MTTEVHEAMSENFQDGENEINEANALFSVDSAQNAPVKAERVIKKAKRTSRSSPRKSESDGEGRLPCIPGVNGTAVLLTKNCRKSKHHGRGLPKKGKA